MAEFAGQQALALFGLLPFRDVLDHADGVEEAPGRAMHGRARHPGPPERIVAPDVLLLDRVDRELASHLPPEQLPISVSVIGMGHVCEAVVDNLLTRIAHEVAMRL